MGISKSYMCTVCHIQFTITIETSYDEETIRDQFPSSAKAIDEGLDDCPFCMSSLEEIV